MGLSTLNLQFIPQSIQELVRKMDFVDEFTPNCLLNSWTNYFVSGVVAPLVCFLPRLPSRDLQPLSPTRGHHSPVSGLFSAICLLKYFRLAFLQGPSIGLLSVTTTSDQTRRDHQWHKFAFFFVLFFWRGEFTGSTHAQRKVSWTNFQQKVEVSRMCVSEFCCVSVESFFFLFC